MPVSTQPASPDLEEAAELTTADVWRLSVAQYHAMADAGILTEDDPVELLEGWLVRKMTKKPPHPVVTDLIREAVRRLLPAGWYVSGQNPLTLETSEPEPDVVVVQGAPLQYLDH